MKRRKRRREMREEKFKCLPCMTLMLCLILQLSSQLESTSFANLGPNNISASLFDDLPSNNFEIENPNNSRALKISAKHTSEPPSNSLHDQDDPLLALESSRLLTIGRGNKPPYEGPLNNSTLSKLYHQTRPSSPPLIAQLSNQPLRILLPTFLKPPSNQPAPEVAWPILPTSSPATISAPSWTAYSHYLTANQTDSFDQKSAPEEEAIKKEAQNTTSELEYEQANFREKSNNNTNTNKGTFPSLVSSPNGEDNFEQNLANGHYQRTNSSNLSWAQLLRQATESNVMESLAVTNKTMVSLLCDTNEMLVRLKFKRPFRGIVMTNLDRQRACRLLGTGGLYYEMRISLKDCGTRQEQPRLFINNIQIQFHPAAPLLDTGLEDAIESKTIICSYPLRPRPGPPPVDNLARNASERIVALAPEVEPAKLIHYEPIVLISGLIVLALLLLGLLSSAYVFTRRRRRASGELSSRLKHGRPNGLYDSPPAKLANTTLLSPPLIEVSGAGQGLTRSQATDSLKRKATKPKTSNTKRPRVRRYPDKPVGALKANIESQPEAQKPNDLKKISVKPNYHSSTDDSLEGDQSSVTTIEIPYSSKNKLQSKAVLIPIQQPATVNLELNSKNHSVKSDERKPAAGPVAAEASKGQAGKHDEREDAPEVMVKESRKTSRRTETVTTLVDTSRANKSESPTEASPNVVHFGKPDRLARFDSFRAKLVSPRDLKRLQDIVSLFEEITVESRVSKVSDMDDDQGGKESTLVVYNTRLAPSKYKARIMELMTEKERRLLSELLEKDEIFRSLIVDSIDNRETFRRKLRDSIIYSGKFKRESWDLLEEILLDKKLGSPDDHPATPKAELEETHIKSADGHKNQPAASSSSSSEGEESVLVELDKSQKETSLLGRQDSLSSERQNGRGHPTTTTGRRSRTNQSPVGSIQSQSVVRVSQFNSSKTTSEGGLTGTLINIDSVMNFTNSKDFTSYTRSSIEHKRTNYEPDRDSLPYVDEKIASYEYARETLETSQVPSNSFNSNTFKRYPKSADATGAEKAN